MPNDIIIKDQISGNSAIVEDSKLHVLTFSTLIPEEYDYIVLTYVAAGNGAGEIETVVYKTGGSGGATVATLTLAYNAEDCLSSVTRS